MVAQSEQQHTGSTPTVEERVTLIRKLVAQRKPSEHLVSLIRMVCDGASSDEVYRADAKRVKP
jgi:hypothetical protein